MKAVSKTFVGEAGSKFFFGLTSSFNDFLDEAVSDMFADAVSMTFWWRCLHTICLCLILKLGLWEIRCDI